MNAHKELIDPSAAVVHLHDLDQVRDVVSGMYCDHRLVQTRRGERLDYGHVHRRMGAISFSRMRYGAAVTVRPGSLSSFFLVQVPLSGGDEFSVDGHTWQSCPRQASVHGPDGELTMRWSDDCEKFVVRVDREALERQALTQLGAASAAALRFAPLVDVGDGAVRAWIEMAQHVFGELSRNPEIARSPLLHSQFEHLLLTTMLSWLPGAISAAPADVRQILPRHVKQAEDYLRAHVDQPVGIEELAQAVGVSGRSLYDGFRKYLGVSPMRYLKDLRMVQARADLLDPAKPRSVTSVATHWGFYQLGRFAIDYRQRFGESPSDTLSKSR